MVYLVHLCSKFKNFFCLVLCQHFKSGSFWEVHFGFWGFSCFPFSNFRRYWVNLDVIACLNLTFFLIIFHIWGFWCQIIILNVFWQYSIELLDNFFKRHIYQGIWVRNWQIHYLLSIFQVWWMDHGEHCLRSHSQGKKTMVHLQAQFSSCVSLHRILYYNW